jgi:glycosyltransferase involved in cell wall biosynthesis
MTDLLREAEGFFASGETEVAKYLFLSILELEPENTEANNDLGVAYYQLGQPDKAIQYIRKALHLDPGYRDALLNYLQVYAEHDRLAEAIPEIKAYLNLHPDDEEIHSLSKNVLRTKETPKLKMAILCVEGLQSFLNSVEMVASREFEVRTAYSRSLEDMVKAAQWADIVWLEWANESAVSLSAHPTALTGKRVVCRLHSYEAFTPFITQIEWSRIHDLVFVADHLRDITLKHNPAIAKTVRHLHVIPSGISLDRFPYRNRRPGKNLAYLGSINYKKGPMLLFQAFASLSRRHPGYHLFIGGDVQDLRYLYYFQQLAQELGISGQIHMEGHIADVPKWFEDKNFIICSSVLESQYLAIMEAMACGIRPLIHNFVGARSIYPKDLLWNTIDDFISLVTEGEYDSRRYRSFVEAHYSTQIQEKRLQDLFRSLTRA